MISLVRGKVFWLEVWFVLVVDIQNLINQKGVMDIKFWTQKFKRSYFIADNVWDDSLVRARKNKCHYNYWWHRLCPRGDEVMNVQGVWTFDTLQHFFFNSLGYTSRCTWITDYTRTFQSWQNWLNMTMPGAIF